MKATQVRDRRVYVAAEYVIGVFSYLVIIAGIFYGLFFVAREIVEAL